MWKYEKYAWAKRPDPVPEDQIAETEARIEIKAEELEAAREAYAEAVDREKAEYEAMKVRIRYMYERGDQSYLNIFLGASSFGDMLTRAEYIEQLYEYDRSSEEINLPKKEVNIYSLELLDIHSFNTVNNNDMGFMFYHLESLTSLEISNINTINVIYMNNLFEGCVKLTSIDLDHFNTSKVKSMNNMFLGCSKLKYLKISNFITSSVQTMSFLFKGCTALISLDLSNFDTSSTTSIDNMFYGCYSLQIIEMASSFKTKNLITMEYLFYNCSSLLSLDLSMFDTSSVVTMSYMFYGCSKLNNLNIKNFNTSSVISMDYMFANCLSLKSIDITNFDFSSVESMTHMFENCSIASIDLSNLNELNSNSYYNLAYMFYKSNNLKYVNIRNLQDANIKSMSHMFTGNRENIVFCLNENNNTNIINTISSMIPCYTISCENNWDKIQKKIIEKTKECVDKCPNDYPYIIDYICYEECPRDKGSFQCRQESYDDDCQIRDYFLGDPDCKLNLYNDTLRQWFIEDISRAIMKNELYDLILDKRGEKKSLILKYENITTFHIYSVSNKEIFSDLTYIDFSDDSLMPNISTSRRNDYCLVLRQEGILLD